MVWKLEEKKIFGSRLIQRPNPVKLFNTYPGKFQIFLLCRNFRPMEQQQT